MLADVVVSNEYRGTDRNQAALINRLDDPPGYGTGKQDWRGMTRRP